MRISSICTLKINFTHNYLYFIIFFIARKSSSVSTPIGDLFASATLILILLSKALNCSSLFFNSFFDCLNETNFFKVCNS